jgi:hypothetical protein
MTKPLFDPDTVSAHVMSRVGVVRVNTAVIRLRDRRVDRVVLQESETKFRLSNKIRVYNQVQIRRCLHLLEAAHQLVYSGYGLAALSEVRSLFETVANYHAVSGKLLSMIESNAALDDIYRAAHLVTYATRNPEMLRIAGTDDVKPPNVLTQIDKMTKLWKSYRENYDLLCEYTHGNASGAVIYFGRDDQRADVVTFTDVGPDPHHELKWVLIGGRILEYVLEAMDRLEAALPSLSERGRREVRRSAS